jgi:hypothetical protein
MIRDLLEQWRIRAGELAPYAPAAAEAFRAAATELEAQLIAEDAVILTLEQAASESGFTADHLRHLVAADKIPNAGARGRPRIRRADLPKKPGAPVARTYDPTADALSIDARRARRGAR